MFIRIVVVAYFTLYQMGNAIAGITGIDVFRAGLLVVTGPYVALRFVMWLRSGNSRPFLPSTLHHLVLVYAAMYSLLYFGRTVTPSVAIANSLSVLIHTLFWILAYTAPEYQSVRRRFFNDLWVGITAAFAVGLVYAQSLTGFTWAPGVVHNLAETTPFIRSDLDVPMMAGILGAIGFVYLLQRRRLAPATGANSLVKYPSRIYGAALVVLCILGALVYGRRTPLFGAIISSVILLLASRKALRVIPLLLLFPLIPLFWGSIGKLLLPLTQNELVRSVFVRNDPESYLTASNRLTTWVRSLDFIMDARISHVWGYGVVPRHMFPPLAEWQSVTHVHNAFMQLFFEGGLLSLGLAVILLVYCYRQLRVLILYGNYRGDALTLLSVFIVWLVLAGVEPMLRGAAAGHLLFLLLCTVVANLYSETTPTPVGARRVAIFQLPRPDLTGGQAA
jgi:hypothetical protein